MFKNLNEKDKKKLYGLGAMIIGCVVVLIALSSTPFKGNVVESAKNAIAEENKEVTADTSNELEQRLKSILSKIEGAGEVDVMVTYSESEQLNPAYNTNNTTEQTKEKDSQGGERTVTTSTESKTMITSSQNDPIVLKTSEAQIKGVIVVSSGAIDPDVKQRLYSAVQTALQIAGHQVEIYTK